MKAATRVPLAVLMAIGAALTLAAAARPRVAAEGAPADAPAATPASMKPRPAEIMPRAAEAPIMGVTNIGEQLIAVGEYGEILASNDGRNWAQMQVPVRSTLTAISFADPQHGWVVGHDAVILHTDDGGKSWTLQNFKPELEKPLLGVLAIDRDHAYAVGAYGLFYRTADGGGSWSAVQALRGDALHLYGIRKLGNGDLLVAGEQGFLGLSTDGGKSWSRQKSPYAGSFFGAVPVGEKGALLCGLRGNAFLSDDVRSGSWRKIDLAASDSLFGCEAVDAGTVAMVGLNGIVELVDTATGAARRLNSPGDMPYSDVAPFKGGLVLVGESGIRQLDSLR